MEIYIFDVSDQWSTHTLVDFWIPIASPLAARTFWLIMLRMITLLCFHTKRPIPTSSGDFRLVQFLFLVKGELTGARKANQRLVWSYPDFLSTSDSSRYNDDSSCRIIRHSRSELCKCGHSGRGPSFPTRRTFHRSAKFDTGVTQEWMNAPSILSSITRISGIGDSSSLYNMSMLNNLIRCRGGHSSY